jgi:hypothetical protein
MSIHRPTVNQCAGVPSVIARRRKGLYRALGLLEAGMAVAAVAGTIGLAGGGIDFGPTINDRLPFHSYPVAAAALATVVALPTGVAAVAALRRRPRSADMAVAAGALLIGWILAEVAFIRTYSWMQPTCVGWGAAVMLLGWLARHH